jgi:hypothetical protein
MALSAYLLAPLRAPAVLTGAKSFVDNPVLGSARLNRMGLHVWRIRTAERMADRRRRRLAAQVDAADADAFARDGFVIRRNALPDAEFAALLREIDRPMPAREMRQGSAVTRFIDLSPGLLRELPTLARLVRGGLFLGLLRYAASAGGQPIAYLHTVITDPDRGRPDPQTAFHADTFHATAKGWLFLADVAEEDGPFSYVRGSHRLTPGRIAWERAQSLTAAGAPNRLHARGSFRATAEDLAEMGYPVPVSFAVPANTLVVADTHGFHARRPSLRPSVRPAIYGSLRRNPFQPWTGVDPFSLPPLREREGLLFGAWLDARARWLGARNAQPRVGDVAPTDPAPRL